MTFISLTLPTPPSANRIWRTGKGKTYKSDDYTRWLQEAGWVIKSKRIPDCIQGPYHVALKVVPKRNKDGSVSKAQRDLDNYIKPISDALQKFGLIEDDKFAQTIFMEWSDAEAGVWVEISQAGVAA